MEYKHEKYDEFIQNIIDTRGQWGISKDEYFETHHIVPECLGGMPKKPVTKKKHKNLIWLYAHEHFIAHKLLAEENPNIKELVFSYWRMASQTTAKGVLIITPEEYEAAKLAWSAAMSDIMTGRKLSDETKLKISNSEKGKVVSEESKAKMSAAAKGRKPWHAGKKLPYMPRPNSKGRIPWNKGLTKETSSSVAKYGKSSGESRKGKKMSEENIEIHANANKKPVLCIETGEIFGCAADAVSKMELNTTKNAIRSCCRGQAKMAAGYHWKYI